MLVKVVVSLLAVCLAVSSTVLVGAPVDADINSPETKEALRFAVAQYNADSDSVYTSEVVKVIKAQVQVVSGLKYIFTVEMARTSCKKEEPESTCTVNSDPAIAQQHECKLAVLSQPWMHSMMLIENNC
ncbi:cystatin-like [Silurus meridionalis]|uniref:cystatin-like n=1 Tax=Silurus meridionalis TaxID=175797 RepID=UPI001EEAD821|nr:cystatin-like [Silurus meridionalis]KAI5108513.1 cystatin C precursor [Silurus meridionalis]